MIHPGDNYPDREGFLPPTTNSPASAFLKNWISEIPPPHPLRYPSDLLHLAQDPGPARHPRRPDSQFLESFPARQPRSHAGANGATPAESRAHRRGAEIQISSFSEFWGAKAKSHEHPPSHIRATHEPIPERIHFVSVFS